MEQLEKTPELNKVYLYKTKKIENYLSIGILILFFASFAEKALSAASIAFYAATAILLLYYFIWFRKKPPYVTIKPGAVVLSRGFFFRLEEIKNEDIKKVEANDRQIEVTFIKEGREETANIYYILLDQDDRKGLVSLLKQIKSE